MQGHIRRRVRAAHEICGRQEVIGEVEGVQEVEGADTHYPPATA